MGLTRTRPSFEILSGDSADVYFARAETILAKEGRDPLVTMEVFTREDAILCGIDEARNLLGHVLAGADPAETRLEALNDGDAIGPKEVVLRIRARYRKFGLYETAFLGMLAQSTGWATAARACVEVAAPEPVISFGARHVHPDITDILDYAAIIGGCVGASTPAGARLAGLAPTGTMPHSLVLIFGDTVEAALAFDRHVAPDVPRIVLVDTFKDEAEEALRVAHALGDRLYGVRLDTPSERGRVTADLVHEVRARLDQAGFGHVKITVSGGLNPERIRYFKEAGAPVDSYAVGSYISGATPIDFTGDIKEIEGQPIAKRGRIPGLTDSPRLQPVDLAAYREGWERPVAGLARSGAFPRTPARPRRRFRRPTPSSGPVVASRAPRSGCSKRPRRCPNAHRCHQSPGAYVAAGPGRGRGRGPRRGRPTAAPVPRTIRRGRWRPMALHHHPGMQSRPDDDADRARERLRAAPARPGAARGRHYAQAAIVLERADRLEPRKGSILEALGRAYFNSGQAEPARATFEALLDVEPASHYGHYALGQSLKRLGRRSGQPAPSPERAVRDASAARAPTCAWPSRSVRKRSISFRDGPSATRSATIGRACGGVQPASLRSRASQSSATSVLPSRNPPPSAAATASRQGIRSRTRCSSSSGPSRSPSAGRRSVARYRCMSSEAKPGAV